MATTLTRACDGSDDRLCRLECQNERLAAQVREMKAVLTIVLTLAAGGALYALTPQHRADGAAAPVGHVVRANAFVIVDKNGVERGSLGYNDAGQVAVLNLEPAPHARLNISAGGEFADLRITHGKNDVNIGCSPKGGTYLEMFDKDGKSIFEQRRR